MSTQTKSTGIRSVWDEVRNEAGTLNPLHALTFVIRCAIRNRPEVGRFLKLRTAVEYKKALNEYDRSIRNGVVVCMQPNEETRYRVIASIAESLSRDNDNKNQHLYINKILIKYDFLEAGDSLIESAVSKSILWFHHAARAGRLGSLCDDLYVAVVFGSDLKKLAGHNGQGPLDPSEAGPLNGLWPLGAPDSFLAFERTQPLDLGLSSTSFRGSIPGVAQKLDAMRRQGGQAAEPPDTGMDTVERTVDSVDELRFPRVGPENDPTLLTRYAGQWVAWSTDGTSIMAHADGTTALKKLVIEAGLDPSQCVFERIDDESQL